MTDSRIHPLLNGHKSGYRLGAIMGILFGAGLFGVLLYCKEYWWLWFPLIFLAVGIGSAVYGKKWVERASHVLRHVQPRDLVVTLRYTVDVTGGSGAHKSRRVRWLANVHTPGDDPSRVAPIASFALTGAKMVTTKDFTVHQLGTVTWQCKDDAEGIAWTKPGKVYVNSQHPDPAILVVDGEVLLSIHEETF